MRRQLSVATRRELIEVVAARYRASNRDEKKANLDEFVEVTGDTTAPAEHLDLAGLQRGEGA